jgi:inhibitor of cysteine peptidase
VKGEVFKIMSKWKKPIVLIFIVTTLFFTIAAALGSAGNGIKILMDGKQLSLATAPQLVNGRVMVSLEEIAKALEITVDWEQNGEKITVQKGDIKAELSLNQKKTIKNGEEIEIDPAPHLQEGKILVPLGFICKTFGYDVNWDETTKTVTIYSQVLPQVGSLENLKRLLKTVEERNTYRLFSGLGSEKAVREDSAALTNQSASKEKADYSTTNVQVEGVDEGDLVKTDGQYIYQVNRERVFITKAYPPSKMEVIKTLKFDGQNFNPQELYVDSKHLVVIGTAYHNSPVPIIRDSAADEKMICPPIPISSTVKAVVYDISNKSAINQLREIELEGNYISSRKIGSALYLVSNKYLDYYGILKENNESSPTPYYRDSQKGKEFMPIDYSDIRYFPGQVQPNYLLVAGFDLTQPTKEMTVSSYLGAGENIYASPENLYVAVSQYDSSSQSNTVVYKFALSKGQTNYLGQGKVPGTVLNQFSMDEHNGYFRIATTSGEIWRDDERTSKNNVYILDKDLKIAGRLENIAPGERIYSVRFMGDRAYMVTFKTVDPLFAIDLKNPTAPKILGALKIPGYSDYLHPYDENHLIGFGKETIELSQKDERGNEVGKMAYYQGMKLAIFDVTNVEKPIEKFKEIIGDRGTESELLRNHRALLFSKEKNLLAFPITVAEVKGAKTEPGGFPKYGEVTFQGAYIYNIDLEKGFTLKGKISHLTDEDYLKAGYNWYESDRNVQRLLYINTTLYSLSNKMIKAHDLTSLKQVGSISLP